MSRELDAEVAEKVMGWSAVMQPDNPEGNDDWYASLSFPCLILHSAGGYQLQRSWLPTDMVDFRPSTDITAAMEVVLKMREQGWSFACTLYEGKLPYASFCKQTVVSSRNAEASTLPEAICKAAIQATASREAGENKD